jgi:hypothetical protein
MRTLIKGMLGEFTAAFQLGDEGLVLLKGPDYSPNLPGTDLVGVTKDGRVWLIDNKAWSAKEVKEVTSLTSELAVNVPDDAAAAGELVSDPRIDDAVARLDRARGKISKLTKKMSLEETKAPWVQAEIGKICKDNNIEFVVTNAGGRVSGLSGALEQALAFKNLNTRLRKKEIVRP